MKRKATLLLSMVLVMLASCSKNEPTSLNVRLKWAYQSQFSGYLVALEKGFYKDVGLEVNIQPAGPDLRPYSTVAAGTDDIGIGIISQLISARSNGVPLVGISQIFQDSPNRFVLKDENKIDSLQQLRGKKVGLWLGGDEIEFVSMLKSVGMSMTDIEVVPQKFSIIPFLENEFVVGQMMVYNELLQAKRQGYENKLQIISPKDYNSAVLGDLIFTNQDFLEKNPEMLRKFLIATFKGWRYTFEHPEEAIGIVLKFNPELDKEEQRQQLDAILSLIGTGSTLTNGIGYVNVDDYENAKRIVLNGLNTTGEEYKKIESLDIQTVFTSTVWESIPASDKMLK